MNPSTTRETISRFQKVVVEVLVVVVTVVAVVAVAVEVVSVVLLCYGNFIMYRRYMRWGNASNI